MLNIFKYFFGVIGVLILAYVLIVVIRTVLITGFSTGKEVVNNENVKAVASSTTNKVANSIENFSLINFIKGFHPFQFSPLYVGYDNVNQPYTFFGNKSDRVNYKTQESLYWQNLNDAPNAHPTDWIPVGKSYSEILFNSENNSDNQEELKVEAKYIMPNIQIGQTIVNNSVINGKAYYKVFTQRIFPIYILDKEGNTLGMFNAYANGDIGPDEMVNFRAVVNLPQDMPRNWAFKGFLMFKNENLEMSQIKAVKVVPVLFAK